MGKNKIKIEKKVSISQRNATYNKRKDGIAKKARELAILCDTPVCLITNSPKGVPKLTIGPGNCTLNDIITRIENLGVDERLKSKLESCKVFRDALKNDEENDINFDERMEPGSSSENPPANEVGLTNKIEIAEQMLQQLGNIRESPFRGTITEMECIHELVNHILAMNENIMFGDTNKRIPMHGAGGQQGSSTQVEMNLQIPSNGNGNSGSPVRSPMLRNNVKANIMNRDIASTSAPVSDPSTFELYPLEEDAGWVDSCYASHTCDDSLENNDNNNDNGLAQGQGNAGGQLN